MKAAAHWGAFRDAFLMSEVFLEKTWLIQSSNFNSHDAVLDLFNFCIVLYVRFRYFLEFTFAILGFLLLAKKIRELLEKTNGEKKKNSCQCSEGWITLGVFWGVCTCSNSIYTTTPMPLYSCLVSPVRWSFGIDSRWLLFWWALSLRRKHEAAVLVLCSQWKSGLWHGWSLWILLLLPAVLLNTSWDNAMLCSWYKKHLFF